MATRDIVPRADSEGGIGTTIKRWAAGWFDAINGKDISSGVLVDSDTAASPTADKIPIASALGKLTAWIDAATTAVAGVVQLATNAIALAGTDAAKAITAAALWYVLTLATRLRISANTTIYVATTGSDSTGDGTSSAPYATIAKALSSIAGKSIDSGVTVTIQVADGTYTVSSEITIDHPDANKIQILGNTSAETTVAISAIDTTAKTITVAGDYTATLKAGHVVTIVGSSTTGLNGGYYVQSVILSGGDTIITCTTSIPSATVGGGSIIIKPCCNCVLSFGNVYRGVITTKPLLRFNGFMLLSSYSGMHSFITVKNTVNVIIGPNIVMYNDNSGNSSSGVESMSGAFVAITGGTIIGLYYCLSAASCGIIVVDQWNGYVVASSVGSVACFATVGGKIIVSLSKVILQSGGYSPTANTIGNAGSLISTY